MYFKCHSSDHLLNLNVYYTYGSYVHGMDERRVRADLSPTAEMKQVSLKVNYSNTGVKEPADKECSKTYYDPVR
jgi:hypothetical protein